MKFKNIFKKIPVLIMALMVSYACTDDFEKLNTDPSLFSSDQLDVGLLLTRVQKRVIVDVVEPFGNLGTFAGYASAAGNYPFQEGDFPGEFNNAYKNLINISEIIRLTENKSDQVNKHAIGRIMRVYIFQHLTDIYGDVPYSEAVRGANDVITQPKYDTQESIYKDMLNELKEAASELDENSEGNYKKSDLIYNGNIDKWRRFANSLRLRLALRIRYADMALASQHIGELVNADLIEDNSGNAFVTTSDDFEDNQNPVYNSIVKNKGSLYYFMGQTIIDILNGGNDPRSSIIATPTPRSVIEAKNAGDESLLEYRGRPIGLHGVNELEAYPAEDLSQIGMIFREPIADMPALYYSEVCFALAESKLVLGLGNTDANTWYQRGIEADMGRYGIDDAVIAEFMNSPTANLSGSVEEQLEQIMNQKEVALFPNSFEAWSEWRRTGYPKILIGSMTDDTNGQIPRRLNYPFVEASLNSANYQEASTRIGGDKLLSKMWWDANPSVPYKHPGEVLRLNN
ncbi:Cell surface glycan-binding lipoprotein, utilization system for glycans and polysaccharides (PUL), SusD family [hydrothermal vent metagenome]|uniref:Cell surface glycan-binding lipoprotein, utilization system for glycans and polysaccharides (PUL), SusD family n=1 Tax=hydrothermal vent metagenome TaxID=652676 RepID=A0A3B0UIG5_9ZZZZ